VQLWACVTLFMTANLIKVLLAKLLSSKFNKHSHLQKMHDSLRKVGAWPPSSAALRNLPGWGCIIVSGMLCPVAVADPCYVWARMHIAVVGAALCHTLPADYGDSF
jgi:hypothetical protein